MTAGYLKGMLDAVFFQIAEKSSEVAKVTSEAEALLRDIEKHIIGRRVRPVWLGSRGEYQITSVDLDPDLTVRAWGLRVLSKDKLGKVGKDLGPMTTERLGL